MAKRRRVGRYPLAFRKRAVERLKSCDHIGALAEELGVPRRSLYRWRKQLEPIGEKPPPSGAVEAAPSRQDAGSGFFQSCLAKSRGSTPAQQQSWRDGIYDQIRELRPLQGSLSIERMCWLAGVSRAGFYRSLEQYEPVQQEMDVRSAIQRIFVEHKRRYGYRRISRELRSRGMLVNHKRVKRMMREDNLLAVQPRAFVVTTDSDHRFEVYLNLARRMKLSGVNQLWVADITYIRLQREFVYLAVILDAYSRKVVGWELDRTLAARLAIAALEKAIQQRRPPPHCHAL